MRCSAASDQLCRRRWLPLASSADPHSFAELAAFCSFNVAGGTMHTGLPIRTSWGAPCWPCRRARSSRHRRWSAWPDCGTAFSSPSLTFVSSRLRPSELDRGSGPQLSGVEATPARVAKDVAHEAEAFHTFQHERLDRTRTPSPARSDRAGSASADECVAIAFCASPYRLDVCADAGERGHRPRRACPNAARQRARPKTAVAWLGVRSGDSAHRSGWRAL